MSSKKRQSKSKKSSKKTPHFPRVNSWQLGHPHSGRNVFADPKEPKRESSVDLLSWKTRYESEKKEKQKLNKRIKQYQSQIKALQISLGKSSSKQAKSMKDVKNTQSLNKKLKQIQRELRINKRKLKMANNDMQKTADYYRKQIETFKKKQNKLLKKNKALINSKKNSNKKGKNNDQKLIKYVFVEDIKKITLRGKGKKAGIRINFIDGEEAVFNNIDIVIPKTMEDDYKDVLNEVKYDDTLLTNESDILDENDYETMQNIFKDELQKRIDDIEKLSQIIYEQKNIFNDVVDNPNYSYIMRTNMIKYVEHIKDRHSQYYLDANDIYEKIKNINENEMKSASIIITDENEDKVVGNIIDEFDLNNGIWRELLLNFPMDIVGILGYELNDRILDLLNVKDVIFENEEALYETIDGVIEDIESRHKDTFIQWNKTNDMMNKWENVVNEVNLNNKRWRQQILFDMSLLNINNKNDINNDNVTDSSDTVEENDNDIDSIQMNDHDDIEEKHIEEIEVEIDSDYKTDNEFKEQINEQKNWLFDDNIRNQFLESVKVNQHSIHLLNFIGEYLNRIIPTSDDFESKELHELYIPILMTSNDPSNIIMACLDGVLFAILINLVEQDIVDIRALHVPNYRNPIPLTNLQICENMTIVFSSIRALDIQLPIWTIDDYLHPNNTVDIILSVVFQLFRGMLNSQINLQTHPELIRLCQNDKQRHDASNWIWSEWLNKWLLFMKEPNDQLISNDFEEKKDIPITSIITINNIESDSDLIRDILHTSDYYDYLILICCRLDPNFVSDTLPQMTDDNYKSAQLLLSCIKNVIGIQTIITIEDIISHNPMLQEILLSDIFEINNKLEKINSTEMKRLTSTIVHIATKQEKALMAWINKFAPAKLHITNLEDLIDGVVILKILDKLKPGCVNWNGVREKDEIRHKFDRLANCKMVMEISRNKFSFSLVGMGASDIADGNLKYIHTLLWQIMRYDSTRLLSELKFNGKLVTDKMMLQWANNRVINYKKYIISINNNNNVIQNNKSKLVTIKSFRDVQLNDSIFFCNLLSSIHGEWINYDIICDIPSMIKGTLMKRNNSSGSGNNNGYNDKLMEQYATERLLNAKYMLTTIRKLGGEIFVLPCDIVNMDPKAISSIFASIMTIAVKHSDDDELKFIENSLQ